MTKEPTKAPKSNMVPLSTGFYLVRTQAGYRRAWKTFVRQHGYNRRTHELKGTFPAKYPSLICFDWMFCRGRWHVQSTVCTELVENLVPVMDELMGPKRPALTTDKNRE